MSDAVKLTLTSAEHKRVDRVMGAPNQDAGGRRHCRCGRRVRYTPDAMWAHTLECEREQAQWEQAS